MHVLTRFDQVWIDPFLDLSVEKKEHRKYFRLFCLKILYKKIVDAVMTC